MPPLVSIIIPCYNAEGYIAEAIRSALGQTYRPIEVIVIDDGSTDGSLKVIRSFGDSIRWETGPNRGGCAARNRGIELARGELIQFLDADDLLHPDKLERQVRAMNETSADLVCCWGQSSLPGDIMDRMYRRKYDGGDPVRFVLRGVLQTSAPLHRRQNLLRVGGFRIDLPCAQERDLHLRLACLDLKFHQIQDVLYTVRRVPGSVSSNSIKVLDQHERILWPAYRRLAESGQLSDERAAAFAALLAYDARWYMRSGLRAKATRYFSTARRMHPSGGLDRAYSRPTRLMHRMFGPILTELFLTVAKSLTFPHRTPRRCQTQRSSTSRPSIP